MQPRTRTIAGGVAAAVLGGGVTAALLLGPNPTGAAAPPTTEVVDDETTGTDDTDGAAADPAETQRGDRLRELLQPLVDSGALSAEDADAIVAELTTAIAGPFGPDIIIRPGLPGGPGFPDGGGNGGPRQERRMPMVNAEVIAAAIGIDAETLRQELRDGATIAEVAEANGVDPQVVIDAMVAEFTERVTALVEGEQLSADEPPASDAAEAPTDTTEATSA